jgi:RNA-directed DNA polymerase
LAKFELALEPNKTKLVEFGKFAEWNGAKCSRKHPETLYFLGFTLYCTRNRKGGFKVGFLTEKSRLQMSMAKLSDLMQKMRHLPVREQVINLNQVLRGHYAYYGIAGNYRSLAKVYRHVERYWRKMLCSRNRESQVTWKVFQKIKTLYPLQRPKIAVPYTRLQAIAEL